MGLMNKLGTGIGTGFVFLGLLGVPETGNNDLLENRVAAAEQAKDVKSEEYKETYTFNEVKTALGERYSRLSDGQKKTVEDNYKKGKGYIKFSYNSMLSLIYNKKTLEALSDEEIKEFSRFKISKLKKEVLDEYLAAFPWIKKENLAEIDKNPRNPDKIFIYYSEFGKELDESLSGMFDGWGEISLGIYFLTRGIDYISDYISDSISKNELNPSIGKEFREAYSLYMGRYPKLIEKGFKEAASLYITRHKNNPDKNKK